MTTYQKITGTARLYKMHANDNQVKREWELLKFCLSIIREANPLPYTQKDKP